MRLLQIPILLSVLGLGVTSAWGQFGLYGSPEMLRLPQANSYGERAGPSVYPAAPAGNYLRPAPEHRRPLIQAAAADDPLSLPPQADPPELPDPGVMDPPADESDCTGDPGCGGCAACDVPSGPGWCMAQAGNWLRDFAFGSCGQSPWYGSVSALVMGRNKPNRLWTSYETGNNPNRLPMTLSMEWRGGGEVRFGRRFCRGYRDTDCGGFGFAGLDGGTWALEATYWTLRAFDGLSIISLSGQTVSTPLIVSDIEFDGVNGTVYFDAAAEHRVWRRNEIHNVEVNLVKYSASVPAASGWDVSWAVGLRYFRFEENFTFGSLDAGYSWGEDGGTHEAFLNDHITNSLVGVQLGFEAGYNALGNCRLFVVPKFGIYNNHIQNYFNAYRGDGTVANPTAASKVTQTYPVSSSRDVASFLAQIDIGLDWRFASRWSARVGYRAVVVTEIGLADEQIPTYVVDIPEIAAIDSNGDLILHGAFLGVTYNF